MCLSWLCMLCVYVCLFTTMQKAKEEKKALYGTPPVCLFLSPSTLRAQLLGKWVSWPYCHFHAYFPTTRYINLNANWISVLSGDVYLCNEGGCGLNWSTPYIKVYIIIRQLLYLRQNGPKKRFNRLWKVKNCKMQGCSTVEVAKLLMRDHQTIKRFVVNRVTRNMWRKKDAN